MCVGGMAPKPDAVNLVSEIQDIRLIDLIKTRTDLSSKRKSTGVYIQHRKAALAAPLYHITTHEPHYMMAKALQRKVFSRFCLQVASK